MADVTNIRAPNTLSGSISSVASAVAVGRTMVTGSPWLPPNPDFTVEWRAHQRLVAVERHRFMRAEHPSRQMTAKRSSRYCVSPGRRLVLLPEVATVLRRGAPQTLH